MLTTKDIQQFREQGIPLEEVERQLERFRRGFPFADIRRPATPGDGISVLSNEEEDRLINLYEKKADVFNIGKFVPASGAASRMFKSLFAFYDVCVSAEKDKKSVDPPDDVKVFFEGLERFAFYDDLAEVLRKTERDIKQLQAEKKYKDILETLLFSPGLDYGSMPKGLILFHHYPDHNRTAFEEHLAEGALHVVGPDGQVAVHFTVAPEHMGKFRKRFGEVREWLEKKFGVKYQVNYLVQKTSTDTIAVTPDNEPFRLPDGKILFRPGGHGALIENLNDMREDIIFIKNIDNVVPDHLKGDTIHYKKVLGGLLIDMQERIRDWLNRMDRSRLTGKEMDLLIRFVTGDLSLVLPDDFEQNDSGGKQKIIYDLLHRPLRICGMVRNEGEPGGGPFWVAGKDGRLSLQIVESAQINMEDPKKKEIVSHATHFNPVDLVCSVKDHRGEKYDLKKYVDPETYFISFKSYDGKELKALELPGLWNDSMAHWITLFVEVPATTFNPVKTVNDLLRREHSER